MPINIDSPLVRRVVALAFLVFIFGLTFWVLSPFLAALAWAGILAYVTWPPASVVEPSPARAGPARCAADDTGRGGDAPAAAGVGAVHPGGGPGAVSATLKQLHQGLPPLPASVKGWPGGEWFAAQYLRVQTDPAWVRVQIDALGLTDAFRLKALVGGVGRNVAKFGLAVFALFFLYRHGASVLEQFRRVAARWLGEASRGYIQAVGVTVRAVVFGIVLTALAQGVLAGLGYWVAGICRACVVGRAHCAGVADSFRRPGRVDRTVARPAGARRNPGRAGTVPGARWW